MASNFAYSGHPLFSSASQAQQQAQQSAGTLQHVNHQPQQVCIYLVS